jgi:hypothetical protein
MSIRVEELVSYAKSINLNSADEIQLRAVVSRAYYAAYHDCLSWHTTLPTPGSAGQAQGGAHTILIAQLTSPTVKGEESTKSKMRGYRLKTLKQLRTKADYFLDENLVADEAAQSVVDTEAILAIA